MGIKVIKPWHIHPLEHYAIVTKNEEVPKYWQRSPNSANCKVSIFPFVKTSETKHFNIYTDMEVELTVNH